MAWQDQRVAYGEETAWGVAATRTKFSRIKAGGIVVARVNREPYQTLGRVTQDRMVDRVEYGEAGIDFPFVYEGIEKILKHCFGSVSTAGAGPYTHTFQVASWPPTGGAVTAEGMSLEANYDLPNATNKARLLTGGLVTAIELMLNVGEDVDVKTEWIGKQVTHVAVTGSPVYPDLETYLVSPHQIGLTVDGTDYSAIVQGLTLRIAQNRNVAPRYGQRYTARPYRSDRLSITGALRVLWEASPDVRTDLWQKFVDGTTGAIIATGTGPSSRAFELRLPKVVYMGDALEMQEGERVPVEFPFECQDDATYSPAQLELTNQTVTV